MNEIEGRAGRINLSLGDVCRRAGVPFSTLWRWRTGAVAPNTRTIDAHLGKLERTLTAAERRAGRHRRSA